MSVITRRIVHTSVAAQIMNSSFSTNGSAIGASFENPVIVYISNLAVRLYIGGNSSVTTASGYILSSASSTNIICRAGEAMWGITSAAVNTTATYLFTNQPV